MYSVENAVIIIGYYLKSKKKLSLYNTIRDLILNDYLYYDPLCGIVPREIPIRLEIQ